MKTPTIAPSQEQHQPVVGDRPLAADPQRVGDRRREHDDGHPDQPHREAEDADVVRDVQVAEPRRASAAAGARPA